MPPKCDRDSQIFLFSATYDTQNCLVGVPTLLHGFKQLLHSKTDGTMAIENESPHTTGGVREVVDDVQ